MLKIIQNDLFVLINSQKLITTNSNFGTGLPTKVSKGG